MNGRNRCLIAADSLEVALDTFFAYYQYRQGLLDADAWFAHSASILGHVGPGAAVEPHWARVSLSYSPSFSEEVERIIDWCKERGIDAFNITRDQREEYLAMLKKNPI
jgi:hypothetical protein